MNNRVLNSQYQPEFFKFVEKRQECVRFINIVFTPSKIKLVAYRLWLWLRLRLHLQNKIHGHLSCQFCHDLKSDLVLMTRFSLRFVELKLIFLLLFMYSVWGKRQRRRTKTIAPSDRLWFYWHSSSSISISWSSSENNVDNADTIIHNRNTNRFPRRL